MVKDNIKPEKQEKQENPIPASCHNSKTGKKIETREEFRDAFRKRQLVLTL